MRERTIVVALGGNGPQAGLLARELGAALFIMATDTDGVYLDWMKPGQRRLGWVTPEEPREYEFPAGSMGPKAEAAGEART